MLISVSVTRLIPPPPSLAPPLSSLAAAARAPLSLAPAFSLSLPSRAGRAMDVPEATLPSTTNAVQPNASTAPVVGGDGTVVVSPTLEDKAALRRARETERKRAKRAADAELRAREAECKRAKRAADAELRAREAEDKRAKRAEDAELRAREAEDKRAKRAADGELRAREAEMRRQHRAANAVQQAE
ncbi:uncharacterized protein LOC142786357 [Rhipicephalus microplus]|uniref:uncharacterized protein LOC142786357 n=1 Tax=Rhipicephalus microplus TaxID=6941 RepID=UPI003F6D101D